MHLTVHEIAFLIKTWNSWYLIQHDNDLNSEYSENRVSVSISPFNCSEVPEETIHEIKEYSCREVTSTTERFSADFVFTAWEHQIEEIIDELKPVIQASVGSTITLANLMEFTETDLPEESEVFKELGSDVAREVKKIKEEQKREQLENQKSHEEKTENPEDDTETEQPEDNTPAKPINKIVITGIIEREYIEVGEITHNGEPLPNLEDFLEAARLFETVELNFPDGENEQEEEKTKQYTLGSTTEEQMAILQLATTSKYESRDIGNNTIETNAPAEDLAAVISFVRYQSKFKLFHNPYEQQLRLKKKQQTMLMRNMMKQGCSCLALGFLILIIILIWFFATQPQPQ